MAKFNHADVFAPIVSGPRAGGWLSGQNFKFFERDDKTGPSIDIAVGDASNGADVPPPWLIYMAVFLAVVFFVGVQRASIFALAVSALAAWLFPRVHAEYIAAVFVHDIGLTKFRSTFSRKRIDLMFLKAMRIERWPLADMPAASDFKAFPMWILRDVRKWFWRLIRPYLIFAGVSLWGVLKERNSYFKPVSVKG